MDSQKLLIVGCGDLGERLVRRLDIPFTDILGLRRNPPSPMPSGLLRYLAMDAADPAQWRSLAGFHPGVIVITMTPDAMSDEAYRRAYVTVCNCLIHYLREERWQPQLVLFVSSTRVYGALDGPVDEQSPVVPEGFAGQRLLEAEARIRDSGLPFCILRFSGIYGRDRVSRDRLAPGTASANAASRGRTGLLAQVIQGRVQRPNHITNRIHADDCAAVLAHLIRLQRQGRKLAPVYLTSDDCPAPLGEVCDWLAGQLGVAPPVLTLPAGGVVSGKRCDNRLLKTTGFRFTYPDYRSGYQPLLTDPAYSKGQV